MAKYPLLIEIGAEELPPKSLFALAQALRDALIDGLKAADLVTGHDEAEWFATPRRLAVRIAAVAERQPDREEQRLGPAVAAGFDADGNPTRAAEGFARSCSVAVEDLQKIQTDKGERLGIERTIAGGPAAPLIIEALEAALNKLPVPKPMRWGNNDYAFVRPVHWIVGLHGEQVVEGQLLGCRIGTTSRGHRFHAPDPVAIVDPATYEARLADAHVLVNVEDRRNKIRNECEALARSVNGNAVIRDELLDEVCSLVEWPVPLVGQFDEAFLTVPAEALISSMEVHQKCFPVVDEKGALMPFFIAVANIDSREPDRVREGFERVIRPRLADARFFWETDRQKSLADHGAGLDAMIYQRSLGTLADKSKRVAQLAAWIASDRGLDEQAARRAAELAKCDLLTEMVGEFPELQGTMGRYYALASGEEEAVAIAIEEQYQPRFAADELPQTDSGRVLAAAERLDTLAGIFAAGLRPSGNRDPFALRRAALGLTRIIVEGGLDLDLDGCLARALAALPEGVERDDDTRAAIIAFIFDRAQGYYLDRGFGRDVFAAVRATATTSPADFDSRIQACQAFAQRPEAEALAAANKRIGNILAKAETPVAESFTMGEATEPAERALAQTVERVAADVEPLMKRRDYARTLETLASLRTQVDAFFDEVLVMAEDPRVRANRLALLASLKALFDDVADIAQLARAA